MKKIKTVLPVFLLLVTSYTFASIEKTSHRGWDDCYRMTNDSLEVVINTSAMGNVMVFKRNSVNFMWEDENINGKGLGDSFSPDAGRFDYGPEKEVREIHDITWRGPYTAEIIDDYTLKITSLEDTVMRIQTTRLFELDSVHPYLKITQTMTNISDGNTNYYFWGRTLIPVGGKLFSPVNPESALEDQWVRYIWGDPTTFSSDPDDAGVKIEDSLFTMIPETADNSKYGTDSESGWMAYGYEGMIFLKTYGYYPDENYTVENGLTNIFYRTRDRFAEMEPVSPAANLAPGESYSFVENWYLIDYPPTSANSFDASEASGHIFSYLETYDTTTSGGNGGGSSSLTELKENNSLLIYPSPARNDFITIRTNIRYNENPACEIYSLQGTMLKRVVCESSGIGSHHFKINVSDLPAGTYILRMYPDGKIGSEIGKFSLVK